MLSKKNNLNKDCFVITPGSDGAIRLCFELFAKPNDKIYNSHTNLRDGRYICKIFKAKQLQITYDEKLNLNLNKI